MKEIYKKGIGLSAAVVVGLGAVGCTKEDSVAPNPNNREAEKVTCTAVDPTKWLSPGIMALTIAPKLGVRDIDARNGKIGGAVCDRPITQAEIQAGSQLVVVKGIGELCIPIGYSASFAEALASEPPQQSERILAACAVKGAVQIATPDGLPSAV